jgi:hypothetical protein
MIIAASSKEEPKTKHAPADFTNNKDVVELILWYCALPAH